MAVIHAFCSIKSVKFNISFFFSLIHPSGQPPPTPAALQLPVEEGLSDNLAEYKPSYEPEYKPEKVVYICSDPDNCPKGFLYFIFLEMLKKK